MDQLTTYYAQRAAEYEQIYARHDRRQGVELLKATLPSLFARRRVLEVACGTGYWTPTIAAVADRVDAFDFNEETLEIARQKKMPGSVTFTRGDAYALPDLGRRHDALFAGCWWSHVPLERLDEFLRGAIATLAPGALLVFADNLQVESSTKISRRDEHGNGYQLRKLNDGSTHEVLKNFPTGAELRERMNSFGRDFRYQLLDCYWLASFTA